MLRKSSSILRELKNTVDKYVTILKDDYLETSDCNIETLQDKMEDISIELFENLNLFKRISSEKLEKAMEKALEQENQKVYRTLKILLNEKEFYESKSDCIESFYEEISTYNAQKLYKKPSKIDQLKRASLLIAISSILGIAGGYSVNYMENRNIDRKASKNIVKMDKETTEESTTEEITTEKITTEESTTENVLNKSESPKSTKSDITDEEIEKIVDKSYEEYEVAYKKLKITKPEIKNIVLFVNNKTQNLTTEQLDEILLNIDKILIPQDAKRMLVSIENRKNHRKYEEVVLDYNFPKISDFIKTENKEFMDEIKDIESSIKLINVSIKSGLYPNSLVHSINRSVVLMEYNSKSIDEIVDSDNKELTYLLSQYRKTMITYAKYLNPGKSYISAKIKGIEYKVQIEATETEEELNQNLSKSIKCNDNILTSDIRTYNQNKSKLADTKYVEMSEESIDEIKRKNNKNKVYVLKDYE